MIKKESEHEFMHVIGFIQRKNECAYRFAKRRYFAPFGKSQPFFRSFSHCLILRSITWNCMCNFAIDPIFFLFDLVSVHQQICSKFAVQSIGIYSFSISDLFLYIQIISNFFFILPILFPFFSKTLAIVINIFDSMQLNQVRYSRCGLSFGRKPSHF